MNQLVLTDNQQVSTWSLIKLHCQRIFKRWKANPTLILMAFIFPIGSFVLMQLLFSGMIELLTRKPMNLADFSLVIAIMSMFTGAITGAGTIVKERKEGIVTRFASLPGPMFVSEAGRVLAETVRALFSAVVTLIVAFIFGADYNSLDIFIKTCLVLIFVAITVGFVAVMLGYASETPQGAVAFAPLIMVFGFFNSAVMPLKMYAPALRNLAKYSPITVASHLITQPNMQVVCLALVYFLSLIIISIIIIRKKVNQLRA